ncbi:glycosyl hydrolase family 65 protein [Weissella confusa]|nr:glycosyl hydrolase family 65 protein [Weissella confusa]
MLSVAVDQNGSHVELLSGEPLTIDLAGEKLTLEA